MAETPEKDAETDDFQKLLDGVRDGEPTRHQIDPDEEDPVTDETADEAWEEYQRSGLVNPFHAVEMQRRQNKQREEQSDDSLFSGTPLETDED
jgi:hypothetical protein